MEQIYNNDIAPIINYYEGLKNAPKRS
jgi:hypothetical protein